MLAPQVIQRLQQNRFLDIAQTSGVHLATLAAIHSSARRSMRSRISSSAIALFLGPFLDRQRQRQHFAQRRIETLDVPLLGVSVGGDMLGDHLVDHGMAHVATVSSTCSSRIRSSRCSKITLRWSFITSSYLSKFLRMSKLRASTFCCAFSRALLIPGMNDRLVLLEAQLGQHAVELSEPKMRIRSSSSDRKNLE